VADERKLCDPIWHRDPGALGLAEKANDDADLSGTLDHDIDKRNRENEPDQQRDEERGENAFLAPGKRSSDKPVQRPEGDRQYAGPGESREKAVQDP
jgi:hypothetical protein